MREARGQQGMGTVLRGERKPPSLLQPQQALACAPHRHRNCRRPRRRKRARGSGRPAAATEAAAAAAPSPARRPSRRGVRLRATTNAWLPVRLGLFTRRSDASVAKRLPHVTLCGGKRFFACMHFSDVCGFPNCQRFGHLGRRTSAQRGGQQGGDAWPASTLGLPGASAQSSRNLLRRSRRFCSSGPSFFCGALLAWGGVPPLCLTPHLERG